MPFLSSLDNILLSIKDAYITFQEKESVDIFEIPHTTCFKLGV